VEEVVALEELVLLLQEEMVVQDPQLQFQEHLLLMVVEVVEVLVDLDLEVLQMQTELVALEVVE
jgi:hypothetical protein